MGNMIDSLSTPLALTVPNMPTASSTSVDGEGGVDGREFRTNRGGLCQKGWTAGALLHHPQRLTTPLLRTSRDAPLAPVGWEAALSYVADRLRALRTEHGPDSVAVFGGGGLTNEKCYLLGKFARVGLGTSQIDYHGRFCMSSAAAGGNRASAWTAGCRSPSPTSTTPRWWYWPARTSPRPCRR